ncbi:MAG: NAD(P)H-dependent oxidoreductase [Pseudomonadota bacterium]
MKVLAFAATNSRVSINRALVEHAAMRLKAEVLPEAEIEFLDLNDYEMPIYSIDREGETGIPAKAQEFYDQIGGADAILISFAEHNGSVTVAWKNIFDWMSRIDVKLWQNKPLLVLAATPGPRAGAGVLQSQEMIAPFFGADIRGMLGVGKWHDVWDTEARTLTRTEDIEALGKALSGLAPKPEDRDLME